VSAAGFVNTEPVLDGDRHMGYLWSYDVGVQREVFTGLALTVDVVATRGYNQTGRIDINEPRLLANGTIGRPGPAVFDPTGTLIPASARNAAFQRVLQYTSNSAFHFDSKALEVSLVRRMANRWSGVWRTLSKANDVGRGTWRARRERSDPRSDYGDLRQPARVLGWRQPGRVEGERRRDVRSIPAIPSTTIGPTPTTATTPTVLARASTT
jgi:hypothetical protein